MSEYYCPGCDGDTDFPVNGYNHTVWCGFHPDAGPLQTEEERNAEDALRSLDSIDPARIIAITGPCIYCQKPMKGITKGGVQHVDGTWCIPFDLPNDRSDV